MIVMDKQQCILCGSEGEGEEMQAMQKGYYKNKQDKKDDGAKG